MIHRPAYFSRDNRSPRAKASGYLDLPTALDGYVVEYRSGGGWRTDNVSKSGTRATITGLENNRTDQVRVAAVNAAWNSRHATASGRPIAEPRKPGWAAYLEWTEGSRRSSRASESR